MKVFKWLLISFLSIVLLIVLVLAGYVGYLQINYYRIGNVELDIVNNQADGLALGQQYSITTFNIGFGAYDREFSFFMDTGVMQDGQKTQGKYGKGVSKQNTIKNTDGAIEILQYLNSDFMILEEVDTKADRSYNVNQMQKITESFANHAYTYTYNFHSGFLAYPLNDMHGSVNSGILTMSRYQINSSERVELPIDQSFINKFFDLDRCINITRYTVAGGKELVLVSVHLSAYDKGGVYRSQQIKLINELISAEYALGNYVIVGGDFNHEIAGSSFPSKQLTPEWLQTLTEDELPNGFRFAVSNLNPTCRDADIIYEKSVTYTSVIDGFIVSDNIEIKRVENIVKIGDLDVEFLYSDHNAVYCEFVLK